MHIANKLVPCPRRLHLLCQVRLFLFVYQPLFTRPTKLKLFNIALSSFFLRLPPLPAPRKARRLKVAPSGYPLHHSRRAVPPCYDFTPIPQAKNKAHRKGGALFLYPQLSPLEESFLLLWLLVALYRGCVRLY
jgi:hypothetical protein